MGRFVRSKRNRVHWDCIMIVWKWHFAVCGGPKRRFKPYATDVNKKENETDVRKARKAELQRDETIGLMSHSHFLFALHSLWTLTNYFCFWHNLLCWFQQESTSYCSCRGSCSSCRIILLSQHHFLAECLIHYVLHQKIIPLMHSCSFVYLVRQQFYTIPFSSICSISIWIGYYYKFVQL